MHLFNLLFEISIIKFLILKLILDQFILFFDSTGLLLKSFKLKIRIDELRSHLLNYLLALNILLKQNLILTLQVIQFSFDIWIFVSWTK